MVFQTEFVCRTRGHGDLRDLTEEFQRLVGTSGVSTGVAHLYVTGSRAAVGTIEHANGAHPELTELLDRLVSPDDANPYNHGVGFGSRSGPGLYRLEENGGWHLQATVLGASLSVPARDGRAALGNHQRVFLLECDVQPRDRTLILTVMGE
jgi:secondary thiamine-phosphate synthase enzyme